MRYLVLLALLLQLAVQVSYTLPIGILSTTTSPIKMRSVNDADIILDRRGFFPGWAKSWKSKPNQVSPAPVSPPPAVKTPPAKPLGPGSYKPRLRQPPAQMTIAEKNRLMANAHGVRAGNEVLAGARGAAHTIRYGGQQSMIQSQRAMNQFRQGNIGQGFTRLGYAAGKGAKGLAYSTVPLAGGLMSGVRSSATSLGYRTKQWTAPRNQYVGGNTNLVREKAQLTRTTTPGYDRSIQYVQNRWTGRPATTPIQPVVTPLQPAIGNMGLQGRPMMEINPGDKPPRRKQLPPFVPLPGIRENGVYQ